MDIFSRLHFILLSQGIITRKEILPQTNIIEDLGYQPCDVAEFFRLVEADFEITLPEEAYHEMIRLDELTQFLSSKQKTI
jgi:acyl carrier protein